MLLPQRVGEHERIETVRLRPRHSIPLPRPRRDLRRQAIQPHLGQGQQELHQQPLGTLNRHRHRPEPPKLHGQHLQTSHGVLDPLLRQHLPGPIQHTQLMERPSPIHTRERVLNRDLLITAGLVILT